MTLESPRGLGLSGGTFRKLALPCQRVSDDGLQIVKARRPSERGTDPVTRGYDLCRVAPKPANGDRDRLSLRRVNECERNSAMFAID
jgi:hypothetical protein